ncbi:outer membrane beta-barrel family protein [Chitinophaga agri]|uniref:TonB-dependent receptor n=1 Tax=Chitinophaga agri TaxID=2703787 RepID=A0A6B9ZLU1_9BACT|nr:outer membrane beta-barrel family protein [Chitinophaga agri]QHS63362.1 TonB-dependent receptor [Chitinophaga agri]
MRIVFSLFFIPLMVFISSNAFSQNHYIVEGIVADQNNKPLAFSTVNLISLPDSVVVASQPSDEQGRFSLSVSNEGNYSVVATYLGYSKGITAPFVLDKDHAIIRLPAIGLTLKQATNLKEVNIVKQKEYIERRNDRIILNIENNILAAGNSAMDILETAPNVSVDRDGNISLRGKKGVVIMINNKPTYLSVSDISNLLRNTPGASIQTIELIANPSSKFDAAGSAGIINIRMKKRDDYGTNWNLSAMAGYGTYYKSSIDLGFNHRGGSFNLYGNYGNSNNKRFNDNDVDRVNYLNQDITLFDQTSNAIRKIGSHNFSVGADYFINPRNVIGVLVSGSFTDASQTMLSKTLIGSAPKRIDSVLSTRNPEKSGFDNMTYNLNYKTVLDTLGQELSFDVDYNRFVSYKRSSYDNFYHLPDGSQLKNPEYLRNSAPIRINIYSAKFDYTVAVKKFKLELGGKTSWVETDNNFQFDSLSTDVWTPTNRSNHFVYHENVNAGYINVKREFQKWSLQFGVRAEQTNSKGDLKDTKQVVKRSYLDFFPTFYATHKFSPDHEMGFSYGRRIDRPSYEDLNPFLFYVDPYTFSRGNPFLNPQYTNSFDLSYTLKNTYSFAFGYSFTDDVMSSVNINDSIAKTVIVTNANIAKQRSYTASANAPVKFTSWWKSNNNLNVFRNEFSSPDIFGVAFSSGQWSYMFNSNQSFNILKDLRAEINFSYQSPVVLGTLKVTNAQHGIDIGVNKSFANNKANLKLSVRDVFNTREQTIVNLLPGMDFQLHQKGETRIGRLTFTYKFGNNKVKQARQRNTGSESESQRIKGAN